MDNKCAPLVEDLFLFCYERIFIMSFSDDTQTDIMEAFNATSSYLDDLLNIDNPHFKGMVTQNNPTELQLNNANSTDNEFQLLDLHLLISNTLVSSKSMPIAITLMLTLSVSPFLDGDVPSDPCYNVNIYIYQHVRFARVSGQLADFNEVTIFFRNLAVL